jgi:hypothetical protein
MTIQPEEAASALNRIEDAGRQSARAYRYQKVSPHFFLWGAIWVVGYGLTYARASAAVIWPLLVVLGILGSFWLGRRRGAKSSRAYAWRYATTVLAAFLFIEALLAILPPKSSLQVDALFPLLVALAYAMLGIWTGGTRIAWLGLVLAALTVGAYFWLPQYFLLWMAAIGGGALILGGVWMRRV